MQIAQKTHHLIDSYKTKLEIEFWIVCELESVKLMNLEKIERTIGMEEGWKPQQQ